MGLDGTDKKIMRHLADDARLSARQLAMRLGMSTATVLSRIRKLEAGRVIRGYAAVVDHEKLGYALTAAIEISARNDRIVGIERELSGVGNVCGVYDITGDTDTLVIAKFRGRDDLSGFVKRLSATPGVEGTITRVVLRTAKEDFGLA